MYSSPWLSIFWSQPSLLLSFNKITNSQDNSIYTLFYLEWIKRFFFIPSVYIYVIQQKYELLIHTRKNSLFHSPKKIFVPHKILAYVQGGWTSLQGAWLPSGHKTRFVWTVLPGIVTTDILKQVSAASTRQKKESTYALSIFERFFTLPPEFNHFSNSLSWSGHLVVRSLSYINGRYIEQFFLWLDIYDNYC